MTDLSIDLAGQVAAAFDALADALAPLDDAAWDTPSLCAGWRVREVVAHMTMPARRLVSAESAMQRLAQLLTGHDWRDLRGFLPEGLTDPLQHRSAVAAALIASLELTRQGRIELQQAAPFGPIMVRCRP